MPGQKTFLSKLGLLPILMFVFWCHFSHLDWGTPSKEKSLQLFKNWQELEAKAPEILALRNKYYRQVDEMIQNQDQLKQKYSEIFLSNLKIPYFSPIPTEEIMDRMRGFLIGVINQEEQSTVYALSQMNPLKGDFSPGIFNLYGGFFYYSAAAALGTGKVLGMLSLNFSPNYYFTHPKETRNMYLLIRAIGALSVVLALLVLFVWMSELSSPTVAYLTILFFAVSPLMVAHSHRVGAHNYSMFWFTLGFFFAWKYYQGGAAKHFLLAGLSLGLAASAIWTNLTTGIVLFLVEWARCRWSIKEALKSKNFWLACAAMGAVFFITNLYILLDFKTFRGYVAAVGQFMSGYGETYGEVRIWNWMPFLKDMFTAQWSWAILPALLAGCYATLKSDRPIVNIIAISFLFLLGVNIALTRHAGVNVRLMPLAAIICAFGVQSLVKDRSKIQKVFVSLYLVSTLCFSGLFCLYSASLNRQPDNLMLAGKWINENIPKGQSIGVLGGTIATVAFPPFQFLQYVLVRFPNEGSTIPYEIKRLPNYVIYCEQHEPIHVPIIHDNYQLLQQWDKPRTFARVRYQQGWVGTGNIDVFVFKKKV